MYRISPPLNHFSPAMTSNSQGNVKDDEFGDIEDEDLMLAETTSFTAMNTSTKRNTPCQFEEDTSNKRSKVDYEATSIELAEQILQVTWGFPNFRLKQRQAITRLINGGSAVVVFPTGGGKSLVYQVPALAFNDFDKLCGRQVGGGITLVVSPLIALMKVNSALAS